uniref:Uncharacterized protein n=1 Tax=Setaria italica TaxID=4555 RepID=K3YBL9_SETIT
MTDERRGPSYIRCFFLFFPDPTATVRSEVNFIAALLQHERGVVPCPSHVLMAVQ